MSGAAPTPRLTDVEVDRLDALLRGVAGESAKSVEWIDGYFAAQICTPTLLRMEEWLPPVFGAETMDDFEFGGMAGAQECVALLMRQRNVIADALLRSLTDIETFHDPILLEDEHGVAHGNEWAKGFLAGTAWDRRAWADLLGDADHGGAVLPMFALAHENDPDPELRQEPIDPAKRGDLLVFMTAGLVKAYAWFEPRRRAATGFAHAPRPIVRDEPKVGRNDPCPCGSGRKYKRCHGAG